DGDRVVVREGDRRWHVDSGQYLLDFEVSAQPDGMAVIPHRVRDRRAEADRSFDEGCRLEESNLEAADAAYRQALTLEPAHAPAAANLGRLLHLRGALDEAEQVYRAGIARSGADALLLFNL